METKKNVFKYLCFVMFLIESSLINNNSNNNNKYK